MEVTKKAIGRIPKCYAVTPLHYQGRDHLLVAAERKGPCTMYSLDGEEEGIIWTEPGGVMTMLQVPGTDGQFLATQRFFSPNDSMEAKIIVATPDNKGGWEIRTLLDLPFVHRFGILERNGIRYLVACTVKSGQRHREDDWSFPGKVYAGILPQSLEGFGQEHQLQMEVVMDGLVKNHGYCKHMENGVEKALISCESGVYKVAPPPEEGGQWEISRLLDIPASDAVLVDLDGDGAEEMAVISPFHGDSISIYRQQSGSMVKVYEYEKPAEFSHSIFGGILGKKPAVVIGHREGERNLLLFTWDQARRQFQAQILDRGCGSANVYQFDHHGEAYLLSANRETDEVALYRVQL